MAEQLFADPKRLPGIDLANQLLAKEASEGRAQALFLGWSEDGTPIFALGQNSQHPKPRLLLIAAPSGDCLIGIGAACKIFLDSPPELEDWQIWIIPALDITRLRQNVAGLGQPKPKPEQHLQSRRSPWAPGENPEENLPINHKEYLQPDQYPDPEPIPNPTPSSPESLALARALEYIKPQLTISLADQPLGKPSLACSQTLDQQDREQLLEALGADSLQALDSLKSDPEQAKTLLGGVSSWQWLACNQPGSVYLKTLPVRLAYPEAEPANREYQFGVEYQMRQHQGQESMTQIYTLQDPEHPAHGLEVAQLAVEGAGEEEQTQQPAWAAVWAIRAVSRRQVLLAKVQAALTGAAEHLQGAGYRRATRILKEQSQPLDRTIKQFARQADPAQTPSLAERCYWSFDYPWQSAAILMEIERCLEDESSVNQEIVAIRQLLTEEREKIEEILGNLVPVRSSEIAGRMQDLILAAAAVCLSGRPALIRVQEQIKYLEKETSRLEKLARNSKLLGYPRADQKKARQAAGDSKQALEEARLELAELLGSVEIPSEATDSPKMITEETSKPKEQAEPVSPEVPPEGQSEDLPPVAKEQPEAAISETPTTEPHKQAENPTSDQSSIPTAEDDISKLESALQAQNQEREPDPEPESLEAEGANPEPAREPTPDNTTGPTEEETPVETQEAATEAAQGQVEPPDLPPVPQAQKPQPVVVEADPQQAIDVEKLLPYRLEIPKEWGHGELYWENQIPRLGEQPLLRSMVRKLMKRGKPADWYDRNLPASELEEAPVHGTALQEPVQPGTVGIDQAQAVGFIRRRIDTEGSFVVQQSAIPTVAAPQTPGSFSHRRRRSV